MLGDRSINELSVTGLKEELHQWLLEAERTIDIPKDWLVTFGKWAEFRTFMEGVLWEYEQLEEQLNEAREMEGRYVELQEAIQEVATELMEIDEIEIDYDRKVDNSVMVDQELGKIIKKLEDLANENWKKPNKVTKKKYGK